MSQDEARQEAATPGREPTGRPETVLSRLGRDRVFIWRHTRLALWTIGIAALVLLPMGRLEESFGCGDCSTARAVRSLSWGFGKSVVSIPVERTVRESRALIDLFPSDHEHEWRFRHSSKIGALLFNTFLTGELKVCGGPGYPNRLGHRWESDDAFRDAMLARIEAGEVTRGDVRRLLALPSRPGRLTSVLPGTHALVREAGRWMNDDFWWPPDQTGRWPPEVTSGRGNDRK